VFDSAVYVGGLSSQLLGRRPVLMDEAVSTNICAAERLSSKDAGEIIVIAERQTGGRGRGGRPWASPPYVNIAASVAWKMPDGFNKPGLVTAAAGAALAESALHFCGVAARIKYPNDLYIGGKKAGGILVERKVCDGAAWAVIGTGVNVNTELWMLPPELADSATSIMIEKGAPVSREKFMADYVSRLEKLLQGLSRGEFENIIATCKRLSLVLNREVTVEDGVETIRGVAMDIDETGALMVKTETGEIRRIISGDTSLSPRNFRLVEAVTGEV